MSMYVCCNDQRRDAIRKQKVVNGIDYLEVVSIPSSPQSPRSTLFVHFINPLNGRELSKNHVQIAGSTRPIKVHSVQTASGNGSKTLRIETDNPENFLTYTLRLIPDPKDPHELPVDPLFSSLDFTYQDSTDIDPLNEQACPPIVQPAPEIDYLARDFNSFRQLMLDRLTTLMPTWTERSEADLGVMLVELLAYVGDYLSYRQDVIATESYLTTARRRVSVRRHARLLGYYMHDGKNARVWVQIQVSDDILASPLPDGSIQPALQKGTALFTRVFGENHVHIVEGSVSYHRVIEAQPLIFETIETAHNLYQQHNQMSFYTWGARNCYLPKGATSATLLGAFPHLRVGDVLIFQEMKSPHTGEEEGAEPTHRCAVRLTRVTVTKDALGQLLIPSPPQPVVFKEHIEENDETIGKQRKHGRHGRHEKHRKHEKHKEHEKDEERQEHEHRQPRAEERKEHKEHQEHRDDEADDDYEDDIETTMKLRAIQSTHQEGRREERHLHARQEPKRGRTKKVKRHSSHEKRHEREERREEQEIDITERITAQLPAGEPFTGEEIEIRERIITEEHDEHHGRVREEERRVIEDVTIREEPNYALDITEIEWAFEDALPFPLCISTTTDYEYGHQYIEDVSVTLGNIVLADHGHSVVEKDFASVPDSTLTFARSTQSSCDEDAPDIHQRCHSSIPIPPRFYPSLLYTPLTHSVAYNQSNPPASAAETLAVQSYNATSAITLTSSINITTDTSNTDDANATGTSVTVQGSTKTWRPRRDLLNCSPSDSCFVAESEADGTTYLRFGDGQYGARPQPGSTFTAYYRVGNGVIGNIGADSIAHILNGDPRIISVNNPLPGKGGKEPESIDAVRLNLPGVFQKQERIVTPQDAKTLAGIMPDVRRANAVLRWTGSWYTLFLVTEPRDNVPLQAFESRLRQYMERFRMVGSDMQVVPPVYVPLEITMNVTVQSGYTRSKVREALLEVFSNGLWPDGQRGLFAPERIDFGQSIYLNPLYAAARTVPGVETVEIETFQRLGLPGDGLDTGELVMDWLELARLDNDPDHPENGVFHLNVKGE